MFIKFKKVKDVEDQCIKEIMDKIYKDRFLITVISVIYLFISAIGIIVSIQINGLFALVIASSVTGQVLICLFILWYFSRLINFLKYHMEG